MANVSKPCALPPIGSQAPVFALAFVLAVSAGWGLAVAETVTEKSIAATNSLPQGNAPIIDAAIVIVSLVIILINFVIDLAYGMFGPRNMLGASVTFRVPEADGRANSKSTVEGATPSSDGLPTPDGSPRTDVSTDGPPSLARSDIEGILRQVGRAPINSGAELGHRILDPPIVMAAPVTSPPPVANQLANSKSTVEEPDTPTAPNDPPQAPNPKTTTSIKKASIQPRKSGKPHCTVRWYGPWRLQCILRLPALSAESSANPRQCGRLQRSAHHFRAHAGESRSRR
jgi:hypothetical protein